MTRRQMLIAAGSVCAAFAQSVPNPRGRKGMGGAPTAFTAWIKANPQGDFIDYCHSLGLGGAEVRGGPPTTPEGIGKLRDKIQSYDMHVIFNVRLPNTDADLPAYDAAVKAASQVGAFGLHAAMTGRRYEQFTTLDAYQKSFEQNQHQIALAEPILKKYKVRLAIENHKGWRAVEQAAWMKRLGSDYVGVHLDFGNNVSFCEDPMFTLETLKPWIFSCHIKDMGVAPYEEGFLLSEVPLGEGFLNLKTMVDTLREKDPNIVFDLEMITRDPLKVPIYTPKYWATFEDIPARQVARIMEIVEKNAPKKPLPKTTGLSAEQQLKLEEGYNLACIRYARENLGL
ncbi:MAG TPA: TIM barrel protein [Bryobacteraceae bacterium]|jgi:sugar phosphate isomerase/epimerase|nr:TIM barrel protein [Bryobacteraceae bacterium]